MKKVVIKIIGEQKYGDEDDVIEMTTIGAFSENEEAYFLEYDEIQQSPEIKIPIVITVLKNCTEASISRHLSKSVVSTMKIKKGVRSLCDYVTSHGVISMGITGKKVEADVNENVANFIYGYNIDSEGQLCSENMVKVVCKFTDY